jgi:hypothetical protein
MEIRVTRFIKDSEIFWNLTLVIQLGWVVFSEDFITFEILLLVFTSLVYSLTDKHSILSKPIAVSRLPPNKQIFVFVLFSFSYWTHNILISFLYCSFLVHQLCECNAVDWNVLLILVWLNLSWLQVILWIVEWWVVCCLGDRFNVYFFI